VNAIGRLLNFITVEMRFIGRFLTEVVFIPKCHGLKLNQFYRQRISTDIAQAERTKTRNRIGKNPTACAGNRKLSISPIFPLGAIEMSHPKFGWILNELRTQIATAAAVLIHGNLNSSSYPLIIGLVDVPFFARINRSEGRLNVRNWNNHRQIIF
jgi:hypothetical protein